MSEADYIAEQIQIESLIMRNQNEELLNELDSEKFLCVFCKLKEESNGLNSVVEENRFPAHDIAMRIKNTHGRMSEKQRKALTNVLSFYAWYNDISLDEIIKEEHK